MLIDAIGYAAGTLTALCFIPQIIHTLKTRSAADVSMWMLILTLLSVMLYEIYAYANELWPVVIMNCIFFVLVTFELVLKIRFSKESPMEQKTKTNM